MNAEDPRLIGLILIGVSPFLVGLNVALLHFLERWYPALFPVAGVALAIGAFQVITGRAARRGQLGDLPLPHKVLLGAAMLGGVVVGLVGNRWLTGEWL
ncbi:MAG: hypothetical protein KC619_10980 [Myxococcales bacterium]|nr:hypothetical protein [Myxococcales bacterium]